MLLVVVGCVISVYGCYLEWIKWSDSSILITRDPSVTTHDPINFPVMTICSTNKISSSKLEAVINEPKLLFLFNIVAGSIVANEDKWAAFRNLFL